MVPNSFSLLAGAAVFFFFLWLHAPSAEAASSPYRLIGVIKAEGFTGAVLADSAGGQILYRLYEQLPDGSKLVKVANDSILLKSSEGVSYEVFIAHDRLVPPNIPVNAGSAVTPDIQTGTREERPALRSDVPTNDRKKRLSRRRSRMVETEE